MFTLSVFFPSVARLFRAESKASINRVQKGKSVFLPGTITSQADRTKLVHRQNLSKMRESI